MAINTMKDFELGNGEHIKLTLNFKKLYQLKSSRKDIYDRYNRVQMNGTEDILDFTLILYTAYLCAQEDMDKVMTEEEFLDALPPYQNVIVSTVMDLTMQKKAIASEEHSGAKES